MADQPFELRPLDTLLRDLISHVEIDEERQVAHVYPSRYTISINQDELELLEKILQAGWFSQPVKVEV